ncbi:hypothetical protein BCR37DRAFT_376184 [Protomyces lactucae-debilis]|uniref:Uncharacterized protein n=1 Tax=Protomyces lactucae-debilis TaxID=2754530 RepID=A0A1Y2FSB1_PROLT|nr:uncharacterized protein BCR37DRAFT_376184 [Protomyces lactucae-debilis]ORY86902.1 hypothetical protein BCR37DRAFT_376184 [Protomyces lactucae-debilis]
MPERDPTKSYPSDIPAWKLIVFSVGPLLFIVAVVLWFFGIRHMLKIRKREAAEQAEWEQFDNDQDVAGPYRGKDAASGSKSDVSSIMTGSRRYQPKHANDSTSDVMTLPHYETTESPSMVEVPFVKGATYIQAPSEHYGESMKDWGYSDPKIAKPSRTQSPTNRDKSSRLDV